MVWIGIGKILVGDERRRSHRRGIMVCTVERFGFVDDNCIVWIDVTAVNVSVGEELLLFLFKCDCDILAP
jgi:hypothetical protein